MVAPVKARADQQALGHAAEGAAQVGVLQAFEQLGDGHQPHELRGRHADGDGHGDEDGVVQRAVEQVVAVVAPHRQLALAVVHSMQPPPPVPLVLGAMHPVADEVEHQQVDHEADQRPVGHAGPQRVQLQRGHAVRAQHADAVGQPVLDGEEHRQLEQAQAVQQGVDHVHADGGAVHHRLDRPAPLRGADQQQQHRDLQQAHQQPAGGHEAVLQQVAQAQAEGRGLDQALEQPLLGQGEGIEGVEHDRSVRRRARRSSPRRPGARAGWQSTGRAPSGPRSAARARPAPRGPGATRCPGAPAGCRPAGWP